jgi:hypothetical protein
MSQNHHGHIEAQKEQVKKVEKPRYHYQHDVRASSCKPKGSSPVPPKILTSASITDLKKADSLKGPSNKSNSRDGVKSRPYHIYNSRSINDPGYGSRGSSVARSHQSHNSMAKIIPPVYANHGTYYKPNAEYKLPSKHRRRETTRSRASSKDSSTTNSSIHDSNCSFSSKQSCCEDTNLPSRATTDDETTMIDRQKEPRSRESRDSRSRSVSKSHKKENSDKKMVKKEKSQSMKSVDSRRRQRNLTLEEDYTTDCTRTDEESQTDDLLTEDTVDMTEDSECFSGSDCSGVTGEESETCDGSTSYCSSTSCDSEKRRMASRSKCRRRHTINSNRNSKQ